MAVPQTILIQVQSGGTVLVGSDVAGVAPPEVKVVEVPETDLSGPMLSDQRKALFGVWRDAFPDAAADQHCRHLFTKAVLGDRITDPSWSQDGEITVNQARHLLTVLGVVSALN